MKHTLRSVVVVVFAIALLAIAKPALANHATGLSITNVSCNLHTVTITITNIGGTGDLSAIAASTNGQLVGFLSGNLASGATQTFTLTNANIQPHAYVVISNGSSGQLPGVIGRVTVVCGPDGFGDGRLNNFDYWETAAVYCEDGGITVYGIDANSKGYVAFKVTKAELAKYPAKPATNILVKQAHGIQFYILSSGEYQINAATKEPGKDYVFRWTGCAAS
jgi:hypothetical protein